MSPHDGFLRLALLSMAFGIWVMLTACALLVWRFLIGAPPQALVQAVIAGGMLAVAGILIAVAGCCVPQRGQSTSHSRLE